MTADDDDWLDQPLTLQDYIEIVGDTIEEAESKFDAIEIRKLIAAVRRKLDELEPDPEPEREVRIDRWWDR